jgi:hypothetical protein
MENKDLQIEVEERKVSAVWKAIGIGAVATVLAFITMVVVLL